MELKLVVGWCTECAPSNDWWTPYWGDNDNGDTVGNYGDGRYDEDDGKVDHLLLNIQLGEMGIISPRTPCRTPSVPCCMALSS